MIDIAIKLGLAAFLFFGVLNLAGLHTWLERKQSAIIQDRIGANRAHLRMAADLGLFHPLADAMKMFTKEDFIPPGRTDCLHSLAPFFSVFFAPRRLRRDPVRRSHPDRRPRDPAAGRRHSTSAALCACHDLARRLRGHPGGLGLRNNYALLGGLRAAAQMISYEIAIGVAIIGIVMVYGSLDMQDIVRAARARSSSAAGSPAWGILVQPLAFFAFPHRGLAETKRIPFDMPEGESEIIGYFVEYSGMKFGMFAMADFLETVVIAGMTTALFLGGWQVPYLLPDGFHLPWGASIPVCTGSTRCWAWRVSRSRLSSSACCSCRCAGLCRAFRDDQLMRLGWLGLFPISVANVLATAGGWRWLTDGSHGSKGDGAAGTDAPREDVPATDFQRPAHHLRALAAQPRAAHRTQPRAAHAPAGGGDLPVSRRAAAPRRAVQGAAPPDRPRRGHAAVRRLHAVRDSLSGEVHHHRGWGNTPIRMSRSTRRASTSISACASTAATAWNRPEDAIRMDTGILDVAVYRARRCSSTSTI